MLISLLYSYFKPVMFVGCGCRHHLFFAAVVVLLQLQGLHVYALWQVLLLGPWGKVTRLQWLLCRGFPLPSLCWLRGGGHPLQAWQGNTTPICEMSPPILSCGHFVVWSFDPQLCLRKTPKTCCENSYCAWLNCSISNSLEMQKKKKYPLAC